MLTLDHVAVSGESLAAATEYVEAALGVALQPGGEHAVFHTHNTLLGLEDGLYLEAIAINPNAPAPDRPRWFALDEFAGPPRLTNWICRTKDIEAVLVQAPMDLGAAVALQRGDLRWSMVVPDDGRLPYDTFAPAVIQWHTDLHPATRLAPSGCRLRRLTVQHPNADALKGDMALMLQDERVQYEKGTPALMAEFDTPHGPRSLSAA